jgi:hypothetical protein
MSGSGHERTFADVRVTSAFPLIADSKRTSPHVSSGPKADKEHPNRPPLYSINSSARSSNCGGMLRPSAFAVFKLITSSNFVGS